MYIEIYYYYSSYLLNPAGCLYYLISSPNNQIRERLLLSPLFTDGEI